LSAPPDPLAAIGGGVPTSKGGGKEWEKARKGMEGGRVERGGQRGKRRGERRGREGGKARAGRGGEGGLAMYAFP